MYRFFSQERRQFLHLTFTADGRRDVATRSAIDYLDSQPLPIESVDSAEAFRIAEGSFGRAFRQNGPVFRMSARITAWRSTDGRRVCLQRDLAPDRTHARASPGMAPLTSFPNQ
jgi:hypothetical protein